MRGKITADIRARLGSPMSHPLPWIGAAFIVFAFFTGGSSLSSVASVPILRPIAALLLCGALLFVRPEEVRAHRMLVAFFGAIVLVVLVQLVPLPPAIWQALPNRGLALAAAQSAGVADEWRPLSLAPSTTTNAAYSLLVPAAALALGLTMAASDRARVVWLMLGLGVVSVFLGALQMLSAPSKVFYLYELAAPFSPDGFFANPNHNAAFLATLLPMVGFAASTLRGRIGRVSKELMLGAVAMLVLVLAILLTGSRAGLALAVVGIASVPLVRRRSAAGEIPRPSWRVLAGMLVGVVGIVAIAALSGRAMGLHRVVGVDATEDLRLRVWPIIAREAQHYFPVGSGWGSFIDVFKVAEPYRLLKPTYLNHAHNEWLEVLLAGGVLGAMLLAVALGWWVLATVKMIRSKQKGRALGWVGLVTILIFGLASFFDYPLRTPCLEVLAIIAWLWVGDALRTDLAGVRNRDPIAANAIKNGTL